MKRLIDYSIIFIVFCLVFSFVGCTKDEQPVLYQCPAGEIVEHPSLCPAPGIKEPEMKEVEIPQEPELEPELEVSEDFEKITSADSLKAITLEDYTIDPFPGNDMVYLKDITFTVRNYKKTAIKPAIVMVLGGYSPYQTRPIAISKTFDYEDEIPPGYKTTITQDVKKIKLEGNRDLKIIEITLIDSLANEKIETVKVQFIPEKII